jgi:predicted Zn-dependent protease
VEIEEKQFPQAIARLSLVLKADPENEEGFELRSRAYAAIGEAAKAASDRAKTAELHKRPHHDHIPN